MARFVNVPNLRGVGIHEHEAYCCPIPPSPRRRHRRSSPPLPPNCVGAHSLLLCLNPRSQTYNVWFKLCLCARQGAGKGHGLRHEGTCDFGSSKMPKCPKEFHPDGDLHAVQQVHLWRAWTWSRHTSEPVGPKVVIFASLCVPDGSIISPLLRCFFWYERW